MKTRYTFSLLLSIFLLYAGTPVAQAQSNTSITAWGWDHFGQTTVPDDLGEILQISAGWTHSLALRADGTVVAWGDEAAPEVIVPDDLDDVIQISAGNNHSLALRADGTVVGWGQDWAQQATPPEGLDNVIQISGGSYHSLALRADGTVVAWGWDISGQTDVPADLTDVVQVAAGGHHSAALRSDGTVVAWGMEGAADPEFAETLSDVAGVSAGNWHVLALLADGTVVGWGQREQGQISIPEDLADVIGIAGGGYYSLALQADGTVVGWGSNEYEATTIPTDLVDATQITAGGYHSMALVAEGSSPVPVAEARTLGSGETVTVIGTVTRAEGAFTYLQDDTAGLSIRQTSGSFLDAVADGHIEPGTRLRVRGELSEFNGLLQVNQGDLESFNLLGQTDLPEPHAITLADLVGDAYQAELVHIENLSFIDADGTFTAATSYDVTDETIDPETVELRVPNESDTDIVGETIPDGEFAFTGVVGSFDAPQLMVILATDVAPIVSTEVVGEIASFALGSAYPNPVRGTAMITFEVPQPEHVVIEVFDLLGQRVATLVDGQFESAQHEVSWNTSSLASGMYLYRMQAGSFSQTLRVTVLN